MLIGVCGAEITQSSNRRNFRRAGWNDAFEDEDDDDDDEND
jgi:hypothetical protein